MNLYEVLGRLGSYAISSHTSSLAIVHEDAKISEKNIVLAFNQISLILFVENNMELFDAGAVQGSWIYNLYPK